MVMGSRRITGLEIQQRDKERVNVYLDGEYAFALSRVTAAHLKTGQMLTQSEIDALRAHDEVTQAVDYAARLLARRPYSCAEIRQRLQTRHFADSAIEQALTRLAELGYVDDRGFARYWIESRERFSPRGPQALRYELRQKGIAPDVIDAALVEMNALDSAIRAAQAAARRWRGLPREVARQKMGAFLSRRGFDYETVHEAVSAVFDQLIHEQPEFFATDDNPDNE
jgi:regulatory protein